MKIRFAVPAMVALLAVPCLRAQSGSVKADPPAALAKVGVINVQVAITNTSEGKQAAAELQSQFAPRMSELDNMNKQIQDIQTRLRTGQSTLSDEEKARLEREGQHLSQQYQRKQQESQEDFNEAQREVIDRIGRKMIDVLDKYSKENGYAVIFDTSAQNTPVIYAANQIDVTQEIIRIYDQNYPVKNAGGKPAAGGSGAKLGNPPRTTSPSTPKPTTPPATQQQKPPQR
jgi:outer membrane protein